MPNNPLSLLLSYPRKRPPLPEKYREIYEKEYIINREGLSFASKLSQISESWMHYKVAAVKGDSILEIGAGTLNHLKYEKYTTYDIIEPFLKFYENKEEKKYINHIYEDISEVPLGHTYDKILSVAVFEHLEFLPQIIAKSGQLLKKNGVFQTAIPCEGGMLWHLSVALSTGLGFRLRNKMSISPIMRHEHINKAKEVIKVIKYFFNDVRIKKFPFPFHHLSFYAYIEARSPRVSAINEYLSHLPIDT